MGKTVDPYHLRQREGCKGTFWRDGSVVYYDHRVAHTTIQSIKTQAVHSTLAHLALCKSYSNRATSEGRGDESAKLAVEEAGG